MDTTKLYVIRTIHLNSLLKVEKYSVRAEDSKICSTKVWGEGVLHYSVCGGERMLLLSSSTQSTIEISSSPPYDANANHMKNRSRNLLKTCKDVEPKVD